MTSAFHKVRFHVADKSREEIRAVGALELRHRGIGRSRETDDKSIHFNSDEAAARFYLSQVFQQDERPTVRRLARGEGTDRAELAPDMRLKKVQESRLTKTRIVHFEQTQKSIPIFGSHVIVELDENRELVDASGNVTNIKDVSAIPSLSPNDALKRIIEFTGTQIPLDEVQPPELTFFHKEEEETWHLAYFFKKVPAAPKDFITMASDRRSRGHGLGLSMKQRNPQLNYLVDAHDCVVLLYYSAIPLLYIPSKCKGVDELNEQCEFWGNKLENGFEMNDPIRFIKTYDLQYQDVKPNLTLTNPANNETYDWSDKNRAAVSAHVNATRVYNFFKSELMRDGIDDKGMDLVSIVNCTLSEEQPPPEWAGACWYNNRMWYGQHRDDSGSLRSYSRFLDVIAHELTHGITEHTSNLVYQNQSGALNESFSDIFGVIIYNWYINGPESDVDTWNWEIGPGLGENGLPLRDMKDPRRAGYPDHMNDYKYIDWDYGGVHINSSIHNKAAYYVLTAQDEDGARVFTPREVALLYYLCLCRLNSLATFSDALESLIDVAKVYWAGDDQERDEKIQHIKDAYQKVGIEYTP